ncbi:hypothetical protein GUJ93_ZPchr0013g36331 [Zizania palustris]|uniref:Retrotransposon protein, putative, Ty3-gypsy subclass n=1 Tax=Zizania palustris TaxID=103762 RepID=A0A8J5X0Y6_ZIZPA|nr:hypothetical protein GUJ93_ZPchr0013g36331 [Zizania palustris]
MRVRDTKPSSLLPSPDLLPHAAAVRSHNREAAHRAAMLSPVKPTTTAAERKNHSTAASPRVNQATHRSDGIGPESTTTPLRSRSTSWKFLSHPSLNKMPVYQVHSFCRHFEGFIRELRMMVTFLGFVFEPEFHGVYMEEFAGPCDVSVTIHGSNDHLPFFTAALGGPTFDVACQRIALQALMELRLIYDDRIQNLSFWPVLKRTLGAHHSIYIGVHSDHDPVMARQTHLLQAMDDLHTEAVLDAEKHHEAKDIAEMIPLVSRRKKPIRKPAPRPKRITPHPAPTGPSSSSVPTSRPAVVTDPIIENFIEPTVPQDPRGSESMETALDGE